MNPPSLLTMREKLTIKPPSGATGTSISMTGTSVAGASKLARVRTIAVAVGAVVGVELDAGGIGGAGATTACVGAGVGGSARIAGVEVGV